MNNEEEKLQREFDLGAVLNITSGRLFTKMDDIYDVLDYLTGSKLFTHMLPEAGALAKSYVLLLHPELQGVGADVVINSQEDADKFVAEQKKIFGETMVLSPIGKSKEISGGKSM